MANIRKANISDANSCAEIVHSWVQATSWMPNRFTLAELETLIEEGMPKREIWVVGDPIFAYLSFDRPNNSIAALYSKTPGQGYGRQLINHIKSHSSLLQLWSHSLYSKAHKFYMREGFVTKEFNQLGADGIPEIRFEWKR